MGGGSDLAHVGPRFGDAEPVTESDRDSLERRDQETLKPVLHGDAIGFLNEIRRERDRRHIYGPRDDLSLPVGRPPQRRQSCAAMPSAMPSGSFVSARQPVVFVGPAAVARSSRLRTRPLNLC